jgi:hypothetical protein
LIQETTGVGKNFDEGSKFLILREQLRQVLTENNKSMNEWMKQKTELINQVSSSNK